MCNEYKGSGRATVLQSSPELTAEFKQAMESEAEKHGPHEAIVSRETHPALMGRFFEELASKMDQ